MSLVPLLTRDHFSPRDQPTLDGAVEVFGQVLNTWAAIGHSPGLFSVYLPFLRQLNGPGALDDRIKHLTAVRVAVLNHCQYTSSHRSTAALGQGVEVDDLVAAAKGDLDAFTDRERVAILLAEEMTVDLPGTPKVDNVFGVSPDVRDVVQELFDPAEVVELVMCISLWNALSRFHRVMGFEMDMPLAPPAVEAEL